MDFKARLTNSIDLPAGPLSDLIAVMTKNFHRYVSTDPKIANEQ